MRNCSRETIEEYDDISTHDEYTKAVRAGLSKEEALKLCQDRSRDQARTPMQWSEEAYGGFTKGKPWLAENPSYKEINVKVQEEDETSVLNYYRRLIAFRKNQDYKEVFTYGSCNQKYKENHTIFAYERVLDETRILVAANFGEEEALLEAESYLGKILLSNMDHSEIKGGKLRLRSNEVVVVA